MSDDANLTRRLCARIIETTFDTLGEDCVARERVQHVKRICALLA